MKKITIAASLMGALTFSLGAYANQPEFTLVEVDMTPMTEVQKPVVVAAKWDSRFGGYALENTASGGQ